MESLAHDLHKHVQGLGVDGWDAFVKLVGHSPFEPGESLNWYLDSLPILKESMKDPSQRPDLSHFMAIRQRYLQIMTEVFAQHRLDALVFPQALVTPPALNDHGIEGCIRETTVSEINIAGAPLVTVPSVSCVTKSRAPVPFAIVFVGLPHSETTLLGLAHEYEQATQLRIVPELVTTQPD